jgi:hypothetical protein
MKSIEKKPKVARRPCLDSEFGRIRKFLSEGSG